MYEDASNNIKTSVIIPVYNAAEYLEECFNSIFSQTQKEIEIIAVNDGSTDGSLELLENIKRAHPEIIIYSQDNQGPGGARNKGIELSKGEFVYFLDSDDCLVPNALELCYQYASQYQLDVVMFDAEPFGDLDYCTDTYDRREIIEQQWTVLSGEEFAANYWLKKFCPTAWMNYISRDFVMERKLNFLSQMYYEDNEFYCKMILQAERVMYIPEMLYRRRYREASIMTSPFEQRHAEDFLDMILYVDELKKNGKAESMLCTLEKKFIIGLYEISTKNRLLGNNSFTEKFYNTALSLYGGSPGKICFYHEIEILYQLSSFLSEKRVPKEMKQKIRNRKMEILETLFSSAFLKEEGKKVGIYGTGAYTEQFLHVYRANYGEIKSQLIFIDSNVVTGEIKYKGYDVLNVNDIERIPLECIIVATSKYEEEICKIIKEKYGDLFKIICLKSDLNFLFVGE